VYIHCTDIDDHDMHYVLTTLERGHRRQTGRRRVHDDEVQGSKKYMLVSRSSNLSTPYPSRHPPRHFQDELEA